jgi:NAD dependent epimerase/dehydratase family enzyme
LLGIDVDSYHAMIWVTSQFFGSLNSWWLTVNNKHFWLNRKQKPAIPTTFDMLVEELWKTTLLPNIQDDAINALLNITQSNMSYAVYTQNFNDFLRRSRQQLTADLQCVRFIN